MGETIGEIRKRIAAETEQAMAPVKKAMRGPKERPGRWLSFGSGMLNLAATGDVQKGMLAGNYYLFVGDSSSGKTFLCMTCLAEAANNPLFKDYTFIFVNAENGAHMDYEKFFGSRMKKRLKVIEAKDCATLEQFYYAMDSHMDNGPCVVILDSQDALSTNDELKKFRQQKKESEDGEKEGKGSYGTSKAKTNSSHMRMVFNKVVETNSILILISQTRDNIGFGSQFHPKTRSGGNALTFYAGLEMWTKKGGHLYSGVINGKAREQGIVSIVRLEKNRLSGKDRTVRIPIYHSAGIDDIGSCIDYLVDEGHWAAAKKEKKKGAVAPANAKKKMPPKVAEGKIHAPEFAIIASRNELREHIITEGARERLYDICQGVWDDIEAKAAVVPDRRYQ